MLKYHGGRALIGLGGNSLPTPVKTPNAIDMFHSSEAMGDKVHSREGNNPDLQLRSLNFY